MQHNLTRKEIFYLGGLVFVAFILKCYFSYKAPLLDDEVYYYLWSKNQILAILNMVLFFPGFML